MIYLCNTLGRIDGNATIVSEVERQKQISILSERNYSIYHTIKESMHLLNDLVSQGIRACIEIDGQQVDFRASAAVPRLYRIKFGRDIYKDLRSLEKSVGDNDEESSSLDLFSLEMFENIAYIMAKHAHPDQVPDTPDEWLENFNTFSIYQILPQLIELWGLNVQTEVEARKNLAKVSG